MKKIILILAVFIAVSATAQTPEAIQKKIDKSNTAIADAKKGSAPSTWVDRANVFYELANAYTNKLIQGLSLDQAAAMIGKPTTTEPVKISGIDYIKNNFEDFSVYTTPADKVIQFWVANKGDEFGALNKSFESLIKVKELSEKDFKSKGVTICEKVAEQYLQSGRTIYSLGEVEKAGDYFDQAAKITELTGKIDTTSLYFAGIAYTEAKNWDKATTTLEKVKTYGYDDGGSVSVALSTCYENTNQVDKAVKVLEDSFEKDPNNSNVMASLINVYLKNKIDPQKVITMVQKAESLDPENASLFMVEGSVWHSIGDSDKAEAAFQKAIALDSKNFNTYFNLGLIRAERGDAVIEKAKNVDINDVKTYNKLVEEAFDIYETSIDALEKAHEINPKEVNTIDMLRKLYLTKQSKGEKYEKKYEYYDKLLKSIEK